ncbi:FGGY-family carbohydrate kinase, partial [bacterium]|nr:FGGY-family carbohydrate kinase [bacterium]
PAGNNGSMMLPFYEPEITPAIDTEGPIFSSDHHYSSGEAVRAVLESQFLNMRTHSDWLGVSPSRIFITGGASENDGIAQVIANVFGVPVDRLDVPGSATIGAGMRAALGLGGDLADLESKFSRPKEGRTLEPDPTSCDTYNGVLPKFKAFLAEQFTS